MFLFSESDTEQGWELAERRKNRRESVIPMNQGLQTWVDLKGVEENEGTSQLAGNRDQPLLVIPVLSRKKKIPYDEIKELLNAGKIKEAKNGVRDSDYEVTDEIRSRLWPQLTSIHEATRTSLDGLYWETVSQMFGSQGMTYMIKQQIMIRISNLQNFVFYSRSPTGRANVASRIHRHTLSFILRFVF